jgi:predicted dehydrogenase
MKTPMTQSSTQVAVIGAGRWGRLHAEKLSALPGVSLVAVVDVQVERAREVALRHAGCQAFDDLALLPNSIDGATVATPADTLYDVASALIRRGLNVFVEKPMAVSVQEALWLHQAALEQKRTVCVGLVERFNPALRHRLRPRRTLKLRRWGTGSPGPCGIGLDWAIHDLDLARWLCGDSLRVVAANHDMGCLQISLVAEGGLRVEIEARSKAAQQRREIDFDGERVDLLNSGGDALQAELHRYSQFIQGAPPGRLGTSGDALEALRLLETAQRLLAAAA